MMIYLTDEEVSLLNQLLKSYQETCEMYDIEKLGEIDHLIIKLEISMENKNDQT